MLRRLIGSAAALIIMTACTPAVDNRVLPTRLQLEVSAATPTPDVPDAPSPAATVTLPAVRSLTLWEPVDSRLSAGENEVWTFVGQQGDNVSLRALGESVKLELALFSPEGVLLREGESILMQLDATGIYSVRVQGVSGAGEYQIGLGLSDRPNPNDISGTPLSVVVGVPTPLPATANLGAFITQLADGQTVGETLTSAETPHVYTYEGAAGQYVTVAMTRVSGEIDPIVTLYTPDGLPLATDSDSAGATNAVARNIRLPQDGIYIIQAAGTGKIGAYALSVDAFDVPPPAAGTPVIAPTATLFAPPLVSTFEQAVNGGLLTNHSPALGQLREAGDLRSHALMLDSNVLLTLIVSPLPESPLIPRVELIDINGVPVAAVTGAESPQNRDALISGFAVAEAGTYTVLVTGEGETFGDYMIAYGIGTTAQTNLIGEITQDRSVEGNITKSYLRDAWYLHLKQGDVISITLIPLDDRADMVIELVNEDGTLLGIDSQTGASRSPQINGVQINHSGLYFIRVSAARAESTGSYALVWRYIDIAPTPDAPREVLPLLTLEDTVPDSAYHFYPFYGRAGQRVRVAVIAEPGTDFDGVAVLLDADAQIIAEGDDSSGSLNPVFVAALPRDGTYNLRVNGYLKGGRYRVLVEELIP